MKAVLLKFVLTASNQINDFAGNWQANKWFQDIRAAKQFDIPMWWKQVPDGANC